MNTKEIVKRAPTNLEAFSTLIILIAMIVVGTIAGVNVAPILVLGTTWAMIIGRRCGLHWKELEEAMVNKISGLISVLLILITIGIMTATFMYSGTIPVFIFYLLKVVSPGMIVVLSFVLCTAVACIIGTSWGTAGTIGVVMISLAQTLGVSMPLVAGAVISGSHVGQILSPMADMTNLAANLGETDLMSSIRRTCKYAVPALVLCVIFYTVLGFMGGRSAASAESIGAVSESIEAVFSTNPVVLLPLAVLLFLCLTKKPIAPALLISSMMAVVIGMVFNGFSLTSGLNAAWSGFNLAAVTGMDVSDISPTVLTLVNRGGMTSWGNTILTLFCAMAYAGVMVAIGSIHVIVKATLSNVKSRVGLTVSTILVGILSAAATCSSYMALIIPTDLMKEKFLENGLTPRDLTSIAGSAAAIFMPVIPWNATTIYMEGISGVSVYKYAPFAVFCWGTCLVAIGTAVIGYGFDKQKNKK